MRRFEVFKLYNYKRDRIRPFKNNEIDTSKYNLVTFIPKNLFYQFRKLSNLYFLCMSLMEVVKPISDSGGTPVMLMPLSFVVLVSMIKDFFEDLKRRQSDKQENNRKVLVGNPNSGQFEAKLWKNLQVGSIVKILQDQFFPSDLILLNSSAPKGICYVETKNLDGETNLKHKQGVKEVVDYLKVNLPSQGKLSPRSSDSTLERSDSDLL